MRHTMPDDREDQGDRPVRLRGGRLRLGLVVCAVLGAVFGLTSPTAGAAPTTTVAGDWRDVSVGEGHTCAIKVDDTLW
jgi:hypothetical protein